MSDKPHIVSWFSCGTASAVNTKLVIAKYGETHKVTVARCIVPEEHEDNDRFARDCEAWFGVPVLELRSSEYTSCENVWTRTRYMSGIHGARCTIEMKKAVRWEFEAQHSPGLQAFGFTAEERPRFERFKKQNPFVSVVSLLIENGLSKPACHAIIDRAGIQLPAMYRLGFANANCIGCVNAESPSYWNRVRRHFPEVFARRAALSRELGVRLWKETRDARTRHFLDELPEDANNEDFDPPMECGLLCYAAERSFTP